MRQRSLRMRSGGARLHVRVHACSQRGRSLCSTIRRIRGLCLRSLQGTGHHMAGACALNKRLRHAAGLPQPLQQAGKEQLRHVGAGSGAHSFRSVAWHIGPVHKAEAALAPEVHERLVLQRRACSRCRSASEGAEVQGGSQRVRESFCPYTKANRELVRADAALWHAGRM